MREIRPYGSEGGGAGCSPYPYQWSGRSLSKLGGGDWTPAYAGVTSANVIPAKAGMTYGPAPVSEDWTFFQRCSGTSFKFLSL
jgi:hypothetical protein